MSCNCNNAFNVPVGNGRLKLGVYQPGAELNVLFKTATGRRDVFAVTCDGTGAIIFPNPQLRLNTPYEVSIALTSDATQTALQWHIGTDNVTCVSFEMVEAWQNDGLLNPDEIDITLKPW